jgi:uncharacterized membrane protein YbhN (UPF0104 family)
MDDRRQEPPVAPPPALTGLPTPDEVLGPVPVAARPRRWVLPLRIAASFAMLGLLLHQVPSVDVDGVQPRWGLENTLWLVVAGALTLVGIVLSTLRWQTVLHALGLRDSRLGDLLSHYLAGQFVSNVLPTTIGGDVLRVSRLSRENGDAPDTFASVVIERLTGWIVLPLITFSGFMVNPGLRELGNATAVAVGVAVATLVALLAVLLAADHDRLLGRFADNEGWRRFAVAVHLGVNRLRRHPAAAFNVIAVGLAYQLVLVFAATAAAAALGISVAGPTVLLAFFPAVLIAQVLPIGIAGLGVREGAFVLFLAPLGVPAEQAIALGLVLYALNLGVSLIGAPAFAVGGRSRTLA